MKTLLTFFVLFFSSPLFADWIFFKKNSDGNSFFYDDKTIIRNNETILFWTLVSYKEKDEFGDMSAIVYTELDCSTIRFKWLDSTYYNQPMGKGNINANFPSDEWVYAQPNSVGNRLMNHICKKY